MHSFFPLLTHYEGVAARTSVEIKLSAGNMQLTPLCVCYRLNLYIMTNEAIVAPVMSENLLNSVLEGEFMRANNLGAWEQTATGFSLELRPDLVDPNGSNQRRYLRQVNVLIDFVYEYDELYLIFQRLNMLLDYSLECVINALQQVVPAIFARYSTVQQIVPLLSGIERAIALDARALQQQTESQLMAAIHPPTREWNASDPRIAPPIAFTDYDFTILAESDYGDTENCHSLQPTMNSITYIGSRVDTLIGRKDEEEKPKVVLEKVTLWHIIVSVLLLRWAHVAFILTSPPALVAEQEGSESVEPVAVKPSAPKKRRKRDSVDLLRRPLVFKTARKTLVLDLDETLIHSMSRPTRLNGSHMVEVELGKLSCIYYVEKRPHCDYFLNTVREWYDLVIFTASVKSYADPMIDWLDQGRSYFAKRLYRDDCIAESNGYVKDLSIVNPNLSRVILVDNSPVSFEKQRDNGVGIQGWISDPSDNSLLHLLPLLNALRFATDVRSMLCLQRGENYNEQQ